MLRRAPLAQVALLLFSILSSLALPRAALADPPGALTVSVAVLALDSDDAEEQADATTGALRSRVRAASGWSLVETTQSLGMLTAAFRCPARPPPDCQVKMAEQLKTDRYIFGFLAKGPTAGQVTAEIHLYQKNKPETVLKETFSDNLKDSNDDALRKVAARIVERFGVTSIGTIVVRSSNPTGDVVVDGAKRVPLERGTAHIEVAAGGHSIEIAAGGTSSKRNVLVAAGRESLVEFAGTSVAEAPPPETKSPAPTRKILGGASMGVGAVLGAIAVGELVHYLDLQKRGDARASQLDKNDPAHGSKPCKEYDPTCLEIDTDSKVASGLAIGLAAGGAVALGVGAYLLFSDPHSDAKTAAQKARIVPTVSAGSGGLVVVGSF